MHPQMPLKRGLPDVTVENSPKYRRLNLNFRRFFIGFRRISIMFRRLIVFVRRLEHQSFLNAEMIELNLLHKPPCHHKGVKDASQSNQLLTTASIGARVDTAPYSRPLMSKASATISFSL